MKADWRAIALDAELEAAKDLQTPTRPTGWTAAGRASDPPNDRAAATPASTSADDAARDRAKITTPRTDFNVHRPSARCSTGRAR